MYVSPIMNFNNSAYNAQIKRANSKGINTENKVDNNRIENYYVTAPSFKMGEYKVAAKAAAAAFTAALATYGIKVAKDTVPQEEAKLPTYEEFEKMIKSDVNISRENRIYLLEEFKVNPEYAWNLYNLKDTNGYHYFWLDNARYKTVYPEITNILLNVQDDNEYRLFDISSAAYLSKRAAAYPKGFAAMLSVKNELGQSRFDLRDFYYANYFEKNPQVAIDNALKKDALGNYMYMASDSNIAKLYEKKEQTEEDRILDIIAKIETPEKKQTIISDNKEQVINAYKKYPEEVTKLLQLSSIKDNRKNRFDAEKINENNARLYKEAPITFMTLANSLCRRNYDIDIDDIEKIMETLCHDKQNDTIHEIDGKTLSDVVMLEYILYNAPGENGNSAKDIIDEEGAEKYIKILEAYRKYPAEFIYIAKNYITRYSYVKAPTVDDILLFKNDREKFEHTL